MASVTSQRPVPHRNVPPSLGFPRYLKEGRAVKTFSLFRTVAGEREPLESFYLPAKGARAFFLLPWLHGTAGIRARPSAALTCGQHLTKPTHGCAQLPGPQCQGDSAGAGRWRNKDMEPCLSSEDSGTRMRSAARGPSGRSRGLDGDLGQLQQGRATRAVGASAEVRSSVQGAEAAGLTPSSVTG